ncbi:hypothetical protein FRC11_009623 [Ceratobasidium sp. 423]|nr:hypothetical protein FRC11_009623 [Ceratobasidium sp. 423]
MASASESKGRGKALARGLRFSKTDEPCPSNPVWFRIQHDMLLEALKNREWQLPIVDEDNNEQHDCTAARQVPGLSNGSSGGPAPSEPLPPLEPHSNCLKLPCPARSPWPSPHWRDYLPIPASPSLGPSPGLQAPAAPIVFYESSPPPEPPAPMASLAFYELLLLPEPVPFDLIPRPHNRIFGNSQSFLHKSILELCMPSPAASPGIEEDIIVISSDKGLSSAEGDTPMQYQLGRPCNGTFGNSQSFPHKSIPESCMPSPAASPGIEEDIIIISSDEELSSAEGDTPTWYQLGQH